MTRIGVVSDTHGHIAAFAKVLKAMGKVDMLIHLGDGADDLKEPDILPLLPARVESVRGNCDWGSDAPEFRVVTVDPALTLYLAHGHNHGVKLSTDRLYYAAWEKKCTMALYGHTHAADLEYGGAVWLMNPGSAGGTVSPSYGILTKEGEVWKPALFRL